MKVCHICSNFDNFFVDFMQEEKKQGIDFRVFYFRAKERGMPSVKAPNLDKRLNFHSWQRYLFFLKENIVLKDLNSLYNHGEFDLYHAHTLFSNGYLAYRLNKVNHKPYIVAVRDTDINVFFKKRPYLRKIGIKILKNASKIIFISDNYKKVLFSKYIPNKYKKSFLKKSCVIPNGVNNFFQDNKVAPKKKIQDKTNFTVLTVGLISHRKNQISVAKAIEYLINKKRLDIKYQIIGKTLDKSIDKELRSFDFIERIPFTEKHDLLDYYRDADVFAMPSLTETFGLTYVEAMTQGLPIIYSQGQGIDSYFKNGQVGYRVRQTDIMEIAMAIQNCVKNIDQLSQNACFFSSNFTWGKVIQKYYKIYFNLLSKH